NAVAAVTGALLRDGVQLVALVHRSHESDVGSGRDRRRAMAVAGTRERGVGQHEHVPAVHDPVAVDHPAGQPHAYHRVAYPQVDQFHPQRRGGHVRLQHAPRGTFRTHADTLSLITKRSVGNSPRKREGLAMAPLRSYVAGTWFTPSDEGAPLRDAATGEEVARISTTGVDMAAALEYGRTVGGPALRELTFHQRAALLKVLASHLREHREELYQLSYRTGATLADSKFDIDGGIGVLFSYSSKGRRE